LKGTQKLSKTMRSHALYG